MKVTVQPGGLHRPGGSCRFDSHDGPAVDAPCGHSSSCCQQMRVQQKKVHPRPASKLCSEHWKVLTLRGSESTSACGSGGSLPHRAAAHGSREMPRSPTRLQICLGRPARLYKPVHCLRSESTLCCANRYFFAGRACFRAGLIATGAQLCPLNMKAANTGPG